MIALRTAVRALWLHRLRSILTMTGIAVGIAAVILMVAIGTATQKQVIDQIQNLGANLMMVAAGQRTGPGGVRLSGDSNVLLTEDDAIAIGTQRRSPRRWRRPVRGFRIRFLALRSRSSNRS